MPTTLLPSILRTWVPLAVGWLLALPLTGPILRVLDQWFGVDQAHAETALVGAVTAVITGAYYLLARIVEVYLAPRLGGILVGLRPSVTPVAYSGTQRAAGPGPDAGNARVVSVVVLAVAALVLAAVPASARRWHPQPTRQDNMAQVIAPRVSRTGVCNGVLVVHFDGTALGRGRTWEPLRDDGSTRLEVHDATGDRWTIVDTRPGGEHVLRWDGMADAVQGGAAVDLVRVVTGGYRSTGWPANEPCA